VPILVFTTMLEEVESGRKGQTIRHNWRFWVRAYEKGQNAHVWLGTPRAGRFKEYAKKLGIFKFEVRVIQGQWLTEEDAHKDGFKHVPEMLLTLASLNRITVDRVQEDQWAVITLKRKVEPIAFGYDIDLWFAQEAEAIANRRWSGWTIGKKFGHACMTLCDLCKHQRFSTGVTKGGVEYRNRECQLLKQDTAEIIVVQCDLLKVSAEPWRFSQKED